MEEGPPPSKSVPLFVVVARILIVTGMSFSAAAAVFFFVGGVWQVGLPSIGASVVFLVLMFLVERVAE